MNAPFKLPVNKTPDILLSGETVEQMMVACNNTVIFAKVQDGSMRPFVDPSPIIQIMQAAVQAALSSTEETKQ
jgi:hypothetical protein